MARRRITPWISAENYDTIKRLCSDDPDMPDTFDEWRETTAQQIANLEASGWGVDKVEVHPQEFTVWCRASGVDENSTTLAAFAVQKAWKQNNGRTKPAENRPRQNPAGVDQVGNNLHGASPTYRKAQARDPGHVTVWLWSKDGVTCAELQRPDYFDGTHVHGSIRKGTCESPAATLALARHIGATLNVPISVLDHENLWEPEWGRLE